MKSYVFCTILIILFKSVDSRFILMDSINECYHAWSERSQSGGCSTASDCKDSNADCMYSIVTNEHICCKPKQDAILPMCPNEQTLLTIGKHNPVVCKGLDDKDTCSDDYKCVKSATEFTKNSGQSNFVCCK